MKRKSVVAIVKVSDDNITTAMEKLLDMLGSMERIVAPFDNVLIKPNWAIDKEYTSGAVTHPEVIKKCVQMVLSAGAKKVIVGDSSIIGKDTGKVIEKNGLDSISSKRVELRDFKKSEYITAFIPNAYKYRRLSFPREVIESDVIINIPVAKTNDCLPVTLGLKNMKGMVPDRIKRRIHRIGLEEAIIDINRAVLADLTIVDCIIGMEGDGPLEGTPVGMNALIASFDPLAAEVVAIKAMGFQPEKMDYIEMAYDAGFGEKDIERMEIVGEKLESVKRDFKTSYYSQKDLSGKGIVLMDKDACSACKNSLNLFLKEDVLEKQKVEDNIYVFAGRFESDKAEGCSKKLGIGACLAEQKNMFDRYVPGCPPLKRHIKEAYTKLFEDSRDEK